MDNRTLSLLLVIGVSSILILGVSSVAAQVSNSSKLDFEIELKPHKILGDKGRFQGKVTISGTSNDTDICPTDTKICEIVINKGVFRPFGAFNIGGNGKYVLEGRIKAFTTDGKDDHNNNVASKFYYFRSDLALSFENENPEKIIKLFKGDLKSREIDVEFDVTNATLVIDKNNKNQLLNVHAERPISGTKSIVSNVNQDVLPSPPGPTNTSKISTNLTDAKLDVQNTTNTSINSPTRHGESYFTEIFETQPSDPVYVVSHSTLKDKRISGPIYKLVGEIKNKGDVEVRFVKITATFYDNDGIVIGTDHTYARPHDILPGQTAPYEFTIGSSDSINVNDIAKGKYNLDWEIQ